MLWLCLAPLSESSISSLAAKLVYTLADLAWCYIRPPSSAFVPPSSSISVSVSASVLRLQHRFNSCTTLRPEETRKQEHKDSTSNQAPMVASLKAAQDAPALSVSTIIPSSVSGATVESNASEPVVDGTEPELDLMRQSCLAPFMSNSGPPAASENPGAPSKKDGNKAKKLKHDAVGFSLRKLWLTCKQNSGPKDTKQTSQSELQEPEDETASFLSMIKCSSIKLITTRLPNGSTFEYIRHPGLHSVKLTTCCYKKLVTQPPN
ncbi:hypothetical protein C8R45DRAFT_947990 [Mycena sanguinolenta]|nr:hypothetical protein C8R45DRAFT_947990 [Mycena sanguinolenta]